MSGVPRGRGPQKPQTCAAQAEQLMSGVPNPGVMSFCTIIACTGLSKDWRNWKPYKHSQPSASLRTTSKTNSINLVPVYPKTKLFSLKGWSKGVHQNGTWHVAVSPLRVPRTNCFVEVYIDAFKLLNDLKNARPKMASVLCCF